jgi:Na+-translocating ferredoxin:NAD+ oxidoreductase RnfD subunit
VESLQVSILLIGVYFALALARKSSALGKYILTVFFSAAVVGLFFVAMDEVSWGQRIFNTQTPDVLIRNNVQEETTIHNLSYFQEKIGIGYLIIGIYGSLAWLIALIVVSRNKSLRYFVPPWYLSGYFFLGFLYNFYSLINPLQSLGDWAESAELMIYCGIMLTLFSIWYENKDHKKTI